MEKDYSHGQMAENTKETISMIKNKEMEYSHGLMVEIIQEIGKMVNKMEKDSIKIKLQK